MVQFQATGLDKIQSGLKAAQALQKSITTGAKQYTQELKQTTRQIEAMGRTFRGKEFRDRVRETDTLVRAQERLTKTMERQASLARLMSGAGMASAAGRGLGMAGVAAGGVAAAGLGMGLAGLSGTVPMARFQNQMDRLQWELGNLLTPYLNIATKATAKAANWLGRQDVGTQNLMGGALLAGAGALGTNVITRAAFGSGIGTIGMKGAGLAAGGASAAFGAARMGGLATMASANMAYGMGGLGGLAGFAAPAVGAAGALALGFGAINSTVRLKNLESERQSIQRGNSGDFLATYDRQFAGLSGDSLSKAVAGERLKILKEGTNTGKGGARSWAGSFIDIFGGNLRDSTRRSNQEEMRMMALAQVAGEKPRPDGAKGHRQNAMVGGDFQEIGAGYYQAFSAAEKLRYDKAEGGTPEKDSTTILQDIYNLIKDSLPGGGAGQPLPPKVQEQLGHAIPSFG
jgi:hypothetical protein